MAVTSTEVAAESFVRAEGVEFGFPDWSAPIDLQDRLHRVPAEQTVKGMFMQQVVDHTAALAGSAGVAPTYGAFEDYPMREWIALLARSAEIAYPEIPVRQGIRRLGELSFATFSASSAGKVLVPVAGTSMGDLLRFVPRYYRLTGRGGIADVSFLAEGRAIVHLRDTWDFPDAYHVGVYEGSIRGMRANGQVRVRPVGKAGADIEIVWW